MLPFMNEDISSLLRVLLEKFTKPALMQNATTTLKPLQVEYNDVGNHVDVTKLNVGFITARYASP